MLIDRTLRALETSLHRDGLWGTARKAPKLARYLRERVRGRAWYADWSAKEAAEGFDRRYGTDTSALVETFELGLAGPNADKAVRYEPAHVSDVERALAALDVDPSRFTLVDLGSGKGRTLLVASRRAFKRLVGVELAPALHAVAVENVRRWKAAGQPGEFSLECLDAARFEPPSGDLVYYLFNPFGRPVLEQVMQRLVDALAAQPREVRIIYVFPAHRAVIEATGRFRSRHEDPRFTIFQSTPAPPRPTDSRTRRKG